MRCDTFIFRGVLSAFTILIVLSLSFINPSLATIGTPHIIYGKISNSGGTPPVEDSLKIYAYIPSRPGELLDKSTVGCGYDVFLNDGWLWFESGNYLTPWSINENLRIIAVYDIQPIETGVIDLVFNSLGSQLLSDLRLSSGDHVGPMASKSMANGANPASIPQGTASITLTATIDDSFSGNSNTQGAEYFIDADPGIGLGTIMTPQDGSFNSSQEGVSASINTYSWTEGSTHSIYVRGKDSANNWGTTHMVAVSVTKPQKIKGDLDRDGDVDNNDLNILLSYRNKPASACPDCDLDGDSMITVLDARKLVLLCTRPRCATQ